MKKTLPLFLILISISLYSSAQDKVSPLSLTDLCIQGSFISSDEYDESLNDFKDLASGSVLLNRDFTGFDEYLNYDEYDLNVDVGGSFSLLAGFLFANKERSAYRKHFQMRVGMTYQSGVSLDYALTNATHTPFDTLTSTLTGEKFFIDSIYNETYTMKYRSGQARLEVMALYFINPDNRLNFYTGIGLSFGSSLNAHTTIEYNHYSNFSSENSYNTSVYYSYSESERKTETIYNKNGFAYTISTPIGIDFRISKNNFFWKKIHLYSELKPGINSVNIPEIRSYAKSNFQFVLGVRLSY